MAIVAVIIVIDRLIAFAAAMLTDKWVPVGTVLLVGIRFLGTPGRLGPESFACRFGIGVFAAGFALGGVGTWCLDRRRF